MSIIIRFLITSYHYLIIEFIIIIYLLVFVTSPGKVYICTLLVFACWLQNNLDLHSFLIYSLVQPQDTLSPGNRVVTTITCILNINIYIFE